MDKNQSVQQPQVTEEIQVFLAELVDKRFAQLHLTAQEKNKIQKVLLEQLGLFMIGSVYDGLPKEYQQDFQKMLEGKKSFEELSAYATEHIKDYEDFIVDVMLDFEDAYLAGELDPPDLRIEYINNLIDQKNFSNLTPEQRQDIFVDIAQRLEEFVIARSLAQLTEEEIGQFKQLLAEKKPRAELQQFTMEHIADYPKFLDETLVKFREAYLA